MLDLWKCLLDFDITPNQIYLLQSIKHKIDIINKHNIYGDMIICRRKNLLDEENKLTAYGEVVVKEFEKTITKLKKQSDKSVDSTVSKDFDKWVNTYREMFPAIKLPSGTLARQSVQELKTKFIWFFKTYPEFDWDMVLNATAYYIDEHKKGTIPFQFMKCSSYFIKKTVNKEITSSLADTCYQIKEFIKDQNKS